MRMGVRHAEVRAGRGWRTQLLAKDPSVTHNLSITHNINTGTQPYVVILSIRNCCRIHVTEGVSRRFASTVLGLGDAIQPGVLIIVVSTVFHIELFPTLTNYVCQVARLWVDHRLGLCMYVGQYRVV